MTDHIRQADVHMHTILRLFASLDSFAGQLRADWEGEAAHAFEAEWTEARMYVTKLQEVWNTFLLQKKRVQMQQQMESLPEDFLF